MLIYLYSKYIIKIEFLINFNNIITMEKCLICLEINDPNMCSNEICLTCKKIFCRKCLFPPCLNEIEDCPHCKTPFVTSFDNDIERCKNILKKKDFKHINYIYYILYLIYTEKNDKENASKYLKLALDNNYNCAYTTVGLNFLEKNDEENYQKNIKLGCDANCMSAHVEMAIIELTKKNSLKTKEILLKAAENNCFKAWYYLGILNYNNKLPDSTYKEAVKWLTKAANINCVESCYYLSNIYYERGNDELAIKYVSIAAERGHMISQYNYATTFFIKEQYCKAIEWYLKSYNQGNQISIINVVNCYFEMSKILGNFIYYEGINILEREIKNKNYFALYKLGYLYHKGNQYIKKDEQKSFQLIKQAADFNYKPAFLILSEMYIKGLGVKKNEQLGYNYIFLYVNN